MAENVIENIISWETTGIEETLKNSAAVKSAMQDTSKAINEADAALGDLNQGVSSFKPLPFDDIISPAIPKLKEAGTEAQEALNKTSGKLFEAGQAGSLLGSVLDKAIPGLGQFAQSILSMNPIAIAGTAAITLLTAAFAANQQQAEKTRQAVEAQVKAESDRVTAQATLGQRVNLAMAGNKEAREQIIKDLAANQAQADILDKARISNEERRIAAQKQYDEQLALSIKHVSDGAAGYDDIGLAARKSADEAKAALETLNKEADDLTGNITANNTQFELLNAATQKLNITEAELNAVRLSGTQGAEGATEALKNLWDTTKEGPKALEDAGKKILDLFKDTAEKVKNGVEKSLEEAAKARQKAEEDLAETSAKLTEVESSRGKALADRVIEEQRAAEMGALQDRLTAAQAYDAAREKNKKIAEIQQQADDAETAAQQKRMADEQKLLTNYIKAESEATEDYNRDRVRKLRDLYNTLQGLAAQGDVAGFVNARRSGLQGIADSDDDAGVAARKRRDAFNQQQKELEDSFHKETETRRQQNQQKLAQERDTGQQEIKQADIVRKQMADLQAQWAKRDLEARRAEEDASYRQTVDVLVKKRNDELKITAGAAAGVIGFFSDMARAAAQLRGFGQQITMRGGTASASAASSASPVYMRGGGQQQANYTIENVNVGKVASPADIAQAVQGLVNGIQKLAQGR